MREIDNNNSLAARERTLRREEAEEVLERQRSERIDKWILQFMASFQQDLRHIDLSGVKLAGASYDRRTIWPEGFEPQEDGDAEHLQT
jgi:hypothetical protein